MASVRRTHHLFFCLEDGVSDGARPLALSLLTGERYVLERAQLDLVMSVPADSWTDAEAKHEPLVELGLLVSDDDDARHRELRERDEALSSNEWNPYAAVYHQMTRWSGVDVLRGAEPELGVEAKAVAQAYVARHGPPPGPFRDPWPAPSIPLPAGGRSGALYRTLAARRTTRAFDSRRPLTLEELSSLLHYVFGCHGHATTIANVVCIKRTSPSGGGLHPIDAYPIVSDVTGLAPGIYHYDVRRHAMALLAELDVEEARRTATSFMCGQSYFGAAPVCFVLAARFYRNHWKYRRHQKAYAGILMDAAHLSQTLHLISAEMGLGAFITLAINTRDIEARLGLDGVSEGVVAMTGCGRPAAGRSPLELAFAPGTPEASPAGPPARAGGRASSARQTSGASRSGVA
jgi:putative peptide maturation dehydrogenase